MSVAKAANRPDQKMFNDIAAQAGHPQLLGGLVKWRAGWRGGLLALLAGSVLPLAFAPLDLFPLAIISPALLFWLWLERSPRQGFFLGYLFGIGFFAAGVSWVSISMHRFGGMGVMLSAVATVLFILFLALFPAVLGWLARRFWSKLPLPFYLMLCLPALWVLLEWVRGWIFTGFPWLSLGYSQTDSPLSGLAPILGVYGVSWTVALSAGVLLWVWLKSGKARLLGLLAALLLWVGAGGLALIDWSQDLGRPLTVSLIQGNITQDIKWHPEQRAPTLDLYTRLSRQRWGRDIVLWPETALPFFYGEAEAYLQKLAFEAQANGGTNLVLGAPVLSKNGDGRYFNSVVRVGAPSQFYAKDHLVPFGEYIPFKSVLGDLLRILQVPMSDFSRGGDQQALLDVAGHKVGVSICYEDAFGEEVIRGLPEASLLINVTNDAWFGESFAPHQHLQMARMRSMETARPMLRATNTGVSAIIDHRGQLQAVSPQLEVSVLDAEVQAKAGITPYVRVGNWLIILALTMFLAFCSYIQQRNRCKLLNQ